MEDSNDVHSEENKVSSEKNPKRKLKTPAQVTALENFYNEHKYPTDKMKLQVAEEIGLTEKQVSGWFCHRRLKDKRVLKGEPYASNGRQDHSSVVIQDRVSGPRQDSCGSTKQGDNNNRYVDAREVESQSVFGHDRTTADLGYGRRDQYLENVNAVDNTSSESSSSLQDRFLSQQEDPYDMGNSRYLIQNGPTMPVHSKAKNTGYKPSGYLKRKGTVEHAAIIDVKMQLGSHYREDGPLLGVEFDLLPPGAFESPISRPVDEPFNIGDSKHHQSPDFSRGRKQSHGIKYGIHASKMSCQDSDNEVENRDTLYGSDYENGKSQSQPKRRSPFLSPFPLPKSPIDKYEDFAGETTTYDIKRKNRKSSKHNFEGIRSDLGLNRDSLYGGKITTKQMKPWFPDSDSMYPKTLQSADFLSRPSHMLLGYNKSIEPEQRGASRKSSKGVKHQRRKMVNDDREMESVKVANHFERDRPVHDYVTKETYSEIPMQANRIKRSTMEMPSSFSEDETAEPSSASE